MSYVGAIVGGVVGLLGGAAEAEAIRVETKAEADLMENVRKDRLSAAYAQERYVRRVGLRKVSEQKVALAKAGVRYDTGSPLELLVENTRQVELEALNIRHRATRENDLAKWYRKYYIARARGRAIQGVVMSGIEGVAGGITPDMFQTKQPGPAYQGAPAQQLPASSLSSYSGVA